MGSRRQKSAYWKSRIIAELRPNAQLKTPDLNLPAIETFDYRDAAKFLPVIIFLAVAFGVIFLQMGLKRPANACAFKLPKQVTGAIPGRPTECVQLEVVQTESALRLGLSGRTELARDRGMLFDFGVAGEQCIWMKDMRFPLDVLWLDQGKRIVHLEKALNPDTYPRLFCSPTPAYYVVEVNAGVIDAAGLRLNQQLNL